MDAYEQSAQAAEEREKIKKEERALKRWVKLINGLRVRRRLEAEYGQSDNVSYFDHQLPPSYSAPNVHIHTVSSICKSGQKADLV